jgi:uncharacterized protein YdeI (YjbR/CyaY-like superfamily)
MPKNDPRIDAYIAKSGDFAKPILNHLRKVVHAACPDVEETIKWRFPFFMRKGILCNMAAFKEHCKFGFWNSKAVFGADFQKARGGMMGQFGRLQAVSDLPDDKTLIGYIKKAVKLNETGVEKPAPARPKVKKKLVVPDFFLTALKKNKKALATFEGFSPSHKREYVEWIAEAKREETRDRRIETALVWLSKGKSRHWKYQNC